ncbi:sensor domain-containing diguanylate cyclase [Novosphingobium olei]|uniref:diguanylate cyclase n=1 Tax=Novosphingobium olei TaxID=2728851 RepID=A0A7Y0G8R2_9SPHN|nr:sensor domain-containing diguanylate cyclase [Novosphingobium olei]NML93351.1 sensor domain-containing diguanylate cyclase [Novosphingobium olei]
MPAVQLFDEPGRLAALHRLSVLDTAPEQPFDRVVSLVRNVLDVPMVSISLVDRDRQWFKASLGLPNREGPRQGSFCTVAIANDGPLVVANATEDHRFAASPLVTDEPHIRSYAGVPLQMPDGYNVGTLCVIDQRPRDFSARDIAMLGDFARIVVNELELRQIVARDLLTGALSRRGFLDCVERELDNARAQSTPGHSPNACLIALDVDHFKRINDGHGHPAGDRVLETLAARITRELRETDCFGRLGGEEFAVLLPGLSQDTGLAIAERIRAALEREPIVVDGIATPLPVTASFGVSATPLAFRDAPGWLAAADAALYEAKRSGRNRCCLARQRSAA